VNIAMSKNKIDYSKYINYALVGYAFFLPFSKAGVNLFETIALLLWLMSGDFKNKVYAYKQNLLIVSFTLFLVVSIVSILWADEILFAIKYILKYRHFLIIFVAFSFLRRDFITHLFSAFLLGMLISELMSYAIFFEIIHYKNVLPSNPSPFMSHTDYSIYLAFTGMILLTRVLSSEVLKEKVVYSIFFTTVTANLFINGGRTGQIAFSGLFLLNFFMHLQHKLKAIMTALFLLFIIFTLSYQLSPNFSNRTNQLNQDINNMIVHDDYSGGFGQRVALWTMGVDAFRDNFFLGTGIGNDMKELPRYAKKHGFTFKQFYTIGFDDHHNTFITAAVQLGVFGLISIIFIFYSVYSLKFKNTNYQILNLTFITAFTLWSLGGITFHTMNPMIFFSLFAGVFNKISFIEMNKGAI